MKKKVLSLSLAATSLLVFGVAGSTACNTAGSFAAASVKLNVSALTLGLGETQQLKASIQKGYSGEVRWFTSNEGVVSVDDGYVFGVGLGSATVTAAYAGGYADCEVTVTPDGGGEASDRLAISPTTKTIGVGDTFKIKTSVYPSDTTVTFTSSNATVASVDENSGDVTGLALGTAAITAIGSNGKTASCKVTVSENGGGSSGWDIAVPENLNYTGALTIGSPLVQTDFMKSLLNDFNSLTGSSISFTVTKFEEDNGTSGYPGPASMPAVFPYASDQTLSLYQFNALSSVSKTDYTWIKDEMGDAAYRAARLTSCVGYPFAGDNGVVMFYNKDLVSDPSEIDTIDKLFAKAGDDYEVNFSIGNGFYAAAALMTYSEGENLYTLTPKDTDFSSKSTFNSAVGLKGAKKVYEIAKQPAIRNAASAPKGDVIATITDVSKVASFKSELGSKYAVAPLPFVEGSIRLGSFLGYKFYGVNNQLSKEDKEKASAVAKFLCSEYAQAKRYDSYNVRPTLKSLESYAAGEPHIAALKAQQDSNSTIALTATDSGFWSATAAAVTSIKALDSGAPDSAYQAILKSLDSELTKA